MDTGGHSCPSPRLSVLNQEEESALPPSLVIKRAYDSAAQPAHGHHSLPANKALFHKQLGLREARNLIKVTLLSH